MNKYFIEHRIKTLARLYEPFEFRGFKLEQWGYTPGNGPTGGAWCASKIIDAPNVDDAFKLFIEELFPIVDRVSFVSQCFAMIELQPFIVLRLNDNSDMRFFFYGSKERPGVPLAFGDDELKAITELEKYHEKGDVFRCLREATNATSFYTRFAMLVSAIEAMAGESPETKEKIKQTDKKYLKKYIIQDETLFNNIFGYGMGIRNVMFHGGKLNLEEERHEGFDYIRDIYQSILHYFHESHSIEINTRVINPMRTPTGSYDILRLWLEAKDKTVQPTLRSVQEAYTKSPYPVDQIEGFEFLGKPPTGY